MKFIVFFIPLFTFSLTSFSAPKGKEAAINYTVKDGLPSNTVYCVEQDLDGCIWFGTDKGLSKFNGREFINFDIADGLPNNEVFNLVCDKKNRIWIHTLSNQVAYYSKGKLFTIQNTPILRYIIAEIGSVRDIFKDNRERIWVITEPFTCFIIDTADNLKKVNYFRYCDKFTCVTKNEKKVLFSTVSGTYRLNQQDKLIPISDKPANHYSEDIILMGNKLVERTYDNKLVFHSIDSTVPMLITGKDGHRLIQIDDNLLANRIVNNGLEIYNTSTGCLNQIILKEQSTSYIFKDRYSKYWVTTLGHGIYLFADLNARKLNNHKLEQVTCISNDEDIVYYAESGGDVFVYEKRTNLLKVVPPQSRELGRLMKIFSEISEKKLLLYDYGICELIKGKQRPFLPKIDAIGSFKNIYFIRGRYYFLCSGGIALYDKKLKHKKYYSDPKRYYTMCDYKGVLYFGTERGISIIRNKEIVDLEIENLNCSVSHLVEFQGSLYIGTSDRGLYKLLRGAEGFRAKKINSCSANSIKQLTVNRNTLFVTTNKGCFILDSAENLKAKISRLQGLLSGNLLGLALDSNKLYFATANNIVSIKRDQQKLVNVPQLNIGSVIVNQDTLYDKRSFHIRSNDKVIINYSIVSSLIEGEIKYYYRILNKEMEWSLASEDFFILNGLPAGDYKLEIYASIDDIEKTSIKSIHILVDPRFWETALFKGALFLAILLLVFFGIRSYYRRIAIRLNAEHVKNNLINELQLKNWQNRFNPHFIFNSLNVIIYFFKLKDYDKGVKFIEQYSDVLRYTVDNSEKLLTSLKTELLNLKKYFEVEKTKKSLNANLQIVVRNENELEPVYIPTFFLQLVVENSIKHGIQAMENGIVKIDVSVTKEEVRCVVSNNGVGLDEVLSSSTGIGLKLIDDKINLLNELLGANFTYHIENINDYHGHVIGVQNIFVFPYLDTDEI